MKRAVVICCIAASIVINEGCSSPGRRDDSHDKTPANEVSKETLEIFRSVRTSDVSDALDSMGLQERYQMDPAMRPLWSRPGARNRRKANGGGDSWFREHAARAD
jgi:hypothetical protein